MLKYCSKHTIAKGNHGFALLLVIVILLLISFLASELILKVRAEQKIAFNAKEQTTARFLSEAGVNLALFRLLEPHVEIFSVKNEYFGDFLPGHIYEIFFNQGKIQYYIVNESGKIDINNAPRSLLELFFGYHGAEPAQTAVIVDSLLDWRDMDNLHRLHGAEQDAYAQLTPPYIPRNGDIKEPAEFVLIYGTDVLHGKFKPEDIFTVHNAPGRINFNSLTPAMLDFVMAGDNEKITEYRAIQKLRGTFNSAMARQVMGDERFDLLKSYLTYVAGVNHYYYVTAIGLPRITLTDDNEKQENNGHRFGIKINTLIKLRGTGFEMLAWTQSYV